MSNMSTLCHIVKHFNALLRMPLFFSLPAVQRDIIVQRCQDFFCVACCTARHYCLTLSGMIELESFESLIGIPISISEAQKILIQLGFNCKKNKKNLLVEIPSWRPDIVQSVDLIEELIRIKGFKNIKLISPERKRENETLNFKQKLFHLSQRSLASKGYLESVTWSFTDSKIDKQFSKEENEIKIINPISSDLDVLRRSIFKKSHSGVVLTTMKL